MVCKSLTECLSLSDEQNAQIDKLRSLSKTNNQQNQGAKIAVDTITKMIEKTDLALLIKASTIYPEIDTLCKMNELTSHWDKQWRDCGLNTPKELKKNPNPLPFHEYKPQPTIPTFDLLKGIFFYGQYKLNRNGDKKDLANDFLKLAAHLGYFAALSALVKKAIEDKDGISAYNYATKTAQLYWTPGYLLLAVVNYSFKNYSESLLNVIVAQKLHAFSKDMLINAYQGKTMDDILRAAGFGNLTNAIHHLAELAEIPMHVVTSRLYSQANNIVKDILQDFAIAGASYSSEITPKEELVAHDSDKPQVTL
jgi:Family of unknown function (DUF5630)